MINFIIYEDSKKWQRKYHDIILKVMGNKKDKYHILTLDKYTLNTQEKIDNLIGKKIFLLDFEVPGKSGLDLARDIRSTNDWQSQIIMITGHKQIKSEGLTSKILMLDFIIKEGNIDDKIMEAITIALRIQSNIESFNFIYDNEFYQLPYQDILYFEKDLNQNYTNIITRNKAYKIRQSITNIERKLFSCPEFYKTHRSCIVNLKNIIKIAWKNNIIYFPHHETNLISRDRKKALKEKILTEI